MPRSTTTIEDAVLAKRNQAVYLRVDIDSDGLGTFVDLTELAGRDWFVSARWGENLETPVATADIELFRESYSNSLAPFMSASRFNQPQKTIEINREIRIYTALTAHSSGRPSASSFQLMFQGYVDEIDFGGDESKISLKCRDLGGLLQDTFIETQRSTGPGTLDSVIQEVLNDNGLSAITLYTPSAPTFTINEYLQRKESVFDAIRKLAQMIGWDVRYLWDNGTSSFRLTLYEPDRTKTVPDITLPASRYDTISQLKISKTRIRNVVQVTYGPNENQRTTVQVSDASSIAKYGRRFMEITESSSSEIDRSTEATSMANAALSDLKDPDAEAAAMMDFYISVQMGDLVRFEANDVHFDTDQDYAIVSYSHNITRERAKTTMVLRGKPSSGVKRWLALEGRAGVAPNNDFEGPEEPAILNLSGEKGALIIEYKRPTDPDWDLTRVHVFGPVDLLRIRTVERVSNASEIVLREPHGLYRTVDISTVTRYNNVATIVTASEHGLKVGATILVDAVDNTYDDATAEVLKIVNSTTFTYVNAGSDSATAADSGQIVITQTGVLVNVDAVDNTYDEVGAAVTVIDEVTFGYPNTNPDSAIAADDGTVAFTDFDEGGQNFIAQTRSDRVEIFGLTPGRRYLIKLVAVDIRGNETSIGTVLENATLYASPIHLNPQYDKDNMIYNGDFQVWTPPKDPTTSPPDIWNCFLVPTAATSIPVDPDIWGSGVTGSGQFAYYDQSIINSTEYSIRLRAAQAGDSAIAPANTVWGLINDREYMPIGGNKIYRMAVSVYNTSASAWVGFFIQLYDENLVRVQTVGFNFIGAPSAQWLYGAYAFRAISTARFMRYEIAKFYTVGELGGSEQYSYFDRVELLNALPGMHLSTQFDIVGTQNLPTGAATVLQWSKIIQLWGVNVGYSGSSVISATIVEEGSYTCKAQVGFEMLSGGNIPAGTDISIEVYINGARTWVGNRTLIPVAVAFFVAHVEVTNMAVSQGDVVDIRLFHNAGATGVVDWVTNDDFNYWTFYKNQ